jgi:hypothetical protein
MGVLNTVCAGSTDSCHPIFNHKAGLLDVLDVDNLINPLTHWGEVVAYWPFPLKVPQLKKL